MPTSDSAASSTESVAATAAQRADAARNRTALLDAARTLVGQSGPDALTMDELARHAGVGKGTVFRRFGSRAGVLLALLDDPAHDLLDATRSDPPPLGPGATPVERLTAFGHAAVNFLAQHGELLSAAGDTVFEHHAYRELTDVLRELLDQAGIGTNRPMLAEFLLAGLNAPLVRHQLHTQGRTPAQVAGNWEDIIIGLAGPSSAPTERMTA